MIEFPSQLLKRYEYRSIIGSGASGVLFLAFDKHLNISVAIKMLSKTSTQDSNLIRFQKEAKASAKLNHDYIVKIRDFGILDDGNPYMVLDYLEGKSLKEHIQSLRQKNIVDELELIKQVSIAMTHAHRHGIIHRDLKSNNIMLQKVGRNKVIAKVIDFGIAQFNSMDVPEGFESTGNKLIGTPAYISPEAIRAEKLDERSDIYSLGCVLFELLTGELPYPGEDVVSVMNKHLNESVPSVVSYCLYDLDSDVLEQLDLILSGALAKDKEERHSSMSDFSASIEQVIKDIEEGIARDGRPESSDAKDFGSDSKLALKQFSNFQERGFQKKVVLAVLVLFSVSVCVFLFLDKVRSDKNMDESRRISSKLSDTMKEDEVVLKTAEDLLDKELGNPEIDDKAIIEGSYKTPDNFSISLEGSKVTDYGVKHIKPQGLHKIDLSNTNITDQSLKVLSQFPQLREITVNYTEITDLGIDYLRDLHGLMRLYVEGTGITDNALASISNFESLKHLDIAYCQNITKSGFVSLTKLEKLERLKISCTAVTPRDVAGFRSLERLTSEFCEFSDADIEAVCNIDKLRTFTVTSSSFPPGGFLKLAQVKDLVMLNIANCKGVSPGEILKFRRIRPRCFIQTELPYLKSVPKEFKLKYGSQ